MLHTTLNNNDHKIKAYTSIPFTESIDDLEVWIYPRMITQLSKTNEAKAPPPKYDSFILRCFISKLIVIGLNTRTGYINSRIIQLNECYYLR